MDAPLFVMTKVASPLLEVQTPVAENTGAVGGVVQVDISAVTASEASLGISSE